MEKILKVSILENINKRPKIRYKNINAFILSCLVVLLIPSTIFSQDAGKGMAWYNYESQEKYELNEFENLPNDLLIELKQRDTLITKIPNILVVDPNIDTRKTFIGYLINNTDAIQTIQTQDNSLVMILEAKDSTDNWAPIEYWSWSSCIHSFTEPLKLQASNHVTFQVPIYDGEITTKLRLKLVGADNGLKLYSKDFVGNVTKEQLYKNIDLSKFYYIGSDDIYLQKK